MCALFACKNLSIGSGNSFELNHNYWKYVNNRAHGGMHIHAVIMQSSLHEK